MQRHPPFFPPPHHLPPPPSPPRAPPATRRTVPRAAWPPLTLPLGCHPCRGPGQGPIRASPGPDKAHPRRPAATRTAEADAEMEICSARRLWVCVCARPYSNRRWRRCGARGARGSMRVADKAGRAGREGRPLPFTRSQPCTICVSACLKLPVANGRAHGCPFSAAGKRGSGPNGNGHWRVSGQGEAAAVTVTVVDEG